VAFKFLLIFKSHNNRYCHTLIVVTSKGVCFDLIPRIGKHRQHLRVEGDVEVFGANQRAFREVWNVFEGWNHKGADEWVRSGLLGDDLAVLNLGGLEELPELFVFFLVKIDLELVE
jgi:hypothetical protein